MFDNSPNNSKISVHRRFTANNSPQGDSTETIHRRPIHRRGDSPHAYSPQKISARTIYRKGDSPQERFTANNSPQGDSPQGNSPQAY
jgi:hypothetical protein